MVKKRLYDPGHRFGAWEVIEEAEPRPYGTQGNTYRYLLCRCTECGITVREVSLANLLNGRSQRCIDCSIKRSTLRDLRPLPVKVRSLIGRMPDVSTELLNELISSASSELERRGSHA